MIKIIKIRHRNIDNSWIIYFDMLIDMYKTNTKIIDTLVSGGGVVVK